MPAAPSSRAVARRAARACPPDATARADVSRLLETGRPTHGTRVVVFAAPGSGITAFVAGRRVGGAVVRNRARRVLRAAWREIAPDVRPGLNVALVARAGIRGAKTEELVTEMRELLARAGVTS
ncbi:MAG: ribonuclease P protein component [Actinomycetota bacterium]